MRVGVYEAVGEASADLGAGEEGGEGGSEEVREFAEGAGGPGVDLEVGWERGGGVGGEVGGAAGVSVFFFCWGRLEIGGGGKGGVYAWKAPVR